MKKSQFVYATYIKTTPEKLWDMLTNGKFIKQYWFGVICESEWKTGSPWKLHFADGSIADSGEIIESIPGKRLAIKWQNQWKPELKAEGYSTCVFEIEPAKDAVKLTVTHGIDREGSKLIEAVSGGWPKVLSNLKSLLETGHVVMEKAEDCREKEQQIR